MGVSVVVDPRKGPPMVVNASGVELDSIVGALRASDEPMVAALVEWSKQSQRPGRYGGMFERDRFVTPYSTFEQIMTAREAIHDDVVGAVADETEALLYDDVGFFAEDEAEQDVWNQWAEDIDLHTRLREIWRTTFTDSQVAVTAWWGRKTYTPRIKTGAGVAHRKTYDLVVPTALTQIDSTKIAPVGSLMYGRERLSYLADGFEAGVFDQVIANRALLPPLQTLDPGYHSPLLTDPLVERLIESRYLPDWGEQFRLARDGINTHNLFLIKEDAVFRHTLTRPPYQRFSDVRMKSVFQLLDLKEQLRQMDRAFLIGGPLRVDQRIATPEGWKAIGAAQVGDEVFTPAGDTANIIGVFPQGVLPMYKVTFSDGADIYCDPSHPWTVKAPKGKWRTIKLQQIIDEGLIQPNGKGASGKPQIRYRHEIPMAEPRVLPERDLPLDPYLLGYLLGDGSFGGESTPSISSCEDGDHPWADCLPAGVHVVPIPASRSFGLSRIPNRESGFKGRSNPVTDGLRLLGLKGVVCADKFVPDDYLWASIPQRFAVLQGLLDTDGSARPAGGAVFGSKSEKLAEGVAELTRSLGGVAKVRRQMRPDGFHRHDGSRSLFFSVEVYVPLSFGPPFRHARKAKRYKARTRPLRRAIVKVERSLDAEAVCIKIDREDGLFTAQHEIACHNSNYLLVVTKGTDQHPAEPTEVDNLREQMSVVARLPVIVGDHRLKIEIVTPKVDATLNYEKYDTLDLRIAARLYQTFIATDRERTRDPVKLGKVISQGLTAKRADLARTLEYQLFRRIRMLNPQLKSRARLVFSPQQISLSFDPDWASFVFDLRAANELSRQSSLSAFGFDQGMEAVLRQREAIAFDAVFNTIQQPGSPSPAGQEELVPPNPKLKGDPKVKAPAPDPPPNDPGAGMRNRSATRSGGRQGGGNRNGGGADTQPGSRQGKEPLGRRSRAARQTEEDDK